VDAALTGQKRISSDGSDEPGAQQMRGARLDSTELLIVRWIGLLVECRNIITRNPELELRTI